MDAEDLEKEVKILKELIKSKQEKGKIKLETFKKIQQEIPIESTQLLKLIIKLEVYQELLNNL